MAFEVEQKFPLQDQAALVARLSELGAEFSGECRQVDQYFNHANRDFAATDEALRIRTVGEHNFLTYKGPNDMATKTRQEIELPFVPGAVAAQQFAELLEVLGFRPVASVHKRRETLHFEWQGRKFEMALDDVESLGRFVELETIVPEAAELGAAQQCLQSLAARLGLSQSERRSYLEMLLARQQSR